MLPLPTADLGFALLVIDSIIRVIALGVIPGNRRPAVGMAWLLFIMFVPTIGIVAFWLLGSHQVGHSRTNRQEKITTQVQAAIPSLPHAIAADLSGDLDRSIATLGQRLGGFPPTQGNAVQLHTDYATTFDQIAAEIDRAEKYVYVQFYIATWDNTTDGVFQAMSRAADRGVQVLFLFDHVGSFFIPGYRRFVKRLAATKIRTQKMLPINPLQGQFRRPDLRNHRKLVIVDGRVGFVGSQNLIQANYHKSSRKQPNRQWVDAMCEVHGPAVTALSVVFATDWSSETGALPWGDAPAPQIAEAAGPVTAQVLPSGPGYARKNNLRLFTALIHAATDNVSITSPYFVPDESLLHAVTSAALRGVRVELFVSEAADQFMVHHAQCSYYRELLRSGVRIYQYPAPKVLHSKFFTVDDRIGVFGSSNMDMRSFALNFEISMLIADQPGVHQLNQLHEEYRDAATELTLGKWLQRPRLKRYVDNVMRLTAELQ